MSMALGYVVPSCPKLTIIGHILLVIQSSKKVHVKLLIFKYVKKPMISGVNIRY